MTINLPLTPHLEQFLREQIASGRFQSADDVVRAAFRLLEEQTLTAETTKAWLKQEIDKGVSSRPAAPATKAFWDGLRARLRAASASADDA